MPATCFVWRRTRRCTHATQHTHTHKPTHTDLHTHQRTCCCCWKLGWVRWILWCVRRCMVCVFIIVVASALIWSRVATHTVQHVTGLTSTKYTHTTMRVSCLCWTCRQVGRLKTWYVVSCVCCAHGLVGCYWNSVKHATRHHCNYD